jgi:hypothetical protein
MTALMQRVALRFQAARRQDSIIRYARDLPKLLRKDYGPAAHYKPAQVSRTLNRYGFSRRDECYAFAIFCLPADFDLHHHSTGAVCDYAAMRAEVSQTYFKGAEFSSEAIIDAAVIEGGLWCGAGGGGGDGGGDGGD